MKDAVVLDAMGDVPIIVPLGDIAENGLLKEVVDRGVGTFSPRP